MSEGINAVKKYKNKRECVKELQDITRKRKGMGPNLHFFRKGINDAT